MKEREILTVNIGSQYFQMENILSICSLDQNTLIQLQFLT